MTALFIEYPVELFYKSQFGFIAFLINGAPFVVIQHFPRFCVSFREYFQINQIVPENYVLLLDQQLKVHVSSAVRWEQDLSLLHLVRDVHQSFLHPSWKEYT